MSRVPVGAAGLRVCDTGDAGRDCHQSRGPRVPRLAFYFACYAGCHHTGAAPTSSNYVCAAEVSRPTSIHMLKSPRPECIRAVASPAMAHSWLTFSLFSEAQFTRHTSFLRRDSRLGIRRDDGQFLDRVLTRLPPPPSLSCSPSPVTEARARR